MEKGLAAEHEGKLLRNALEHLLDGSGVTNESGGHLESLGRNIANTKAVRYRPWRGSAALIMF